MKIALISLSEQGARVAAELAGKLGECDVYLHKGTASAAASGPLSPIGPQPQPRLSPAHCAPGDSLGPDMPLTQSESVDGAEAVPAQFDRILDLVPQLWDHYRGLVFVAPTGLIVRAIAPCIRHKTTDPAVVAVDVGGRWAVSLLSGHEGGANELAMRVANALDAEPVISTTTEAARALIVGIGCRRGTSADAIIEAVKGALARVDATIEQVRLLASADLKSDEPGLLEAARQLGVPIRFVSSQAIRDCTREFGRSEFVQDKVDLPAVAEPAALLAGRRTRLLLGKQIFPGVTVAVARESCLWSA